MMLCICNIFGMPLRKPRITWSMSMSRLFLRVSSSKMAFSDSSRSSVKRQDASPQSCMHSTRRLLDSPANRRKSAG